MDTVEGGRHRGSHVLHRIPGALQGCCRTAAQYQRICNHEVPRRYNKVQVTPTCTARRSSSRLVSSARQRSDPVLAS